MKRSTWEDYADFMSQILEHMWEICFTINLHKLEMVGEEENIEMYLS